MLKIRGERITQAGLIAEVIKETPSRVTVEIKELFFPKHKTQTGTYQIDQNQHEYLRDLIIGQERVFWTKGTRAGFEIGGNRKIIDWNF